MINKESPMSYFGKEIITGNWTISLDTKRLSMCPGASKLLELSRNKDRGLHCIFEMIDPQERWKLIREFNMAIRNKASFEKQVKILTINGQTKWMHIRGVLNYRRWGTPDKMIGIIEDITQKQIEESTSLSIVSHELRTPLTIIKLNMQMVKGLLEHNTFHGIPRLLERADFHVDFMTRLIEEYGRNSGIRNHVRTDLIQFNLRQLIESIVTEVKTMYSSHRFSTNLPTEILVRADKYKILQVLVNYLTNAVSYSPHASLVCVNAMIAHGFVVVSVHDQGIGVPAGAEEQIFEKFYRGTCFKQSSSRNRGLGLYLVKQIITQHGGEVKAEKGELKGSVFTFTLPVSFHGGNL